jgi:8-oxo-dGTP pyrophosphatase MutT (NUDIX family)
MEPTVSALPAFDPRLVPVEATDQHLPPVQAEHLSAQALRQRFAQNRAWSPEICSDPGISRRTPVPAAVLVPLVLRDQVMVLLTERTTRLSSHSGQVAFPGGKSDPEDASSQATALREAHEEIGLSSQFVDVVGSLPLYTTVTAFEVTPVVALVTPGFSVVPNPHEVARVFEVPLAFLMNPANHRRHAVEWGGLRREWLSMPYQDAEHEHFIWGATAAMLRNLYGFLRAPL